MARVTSVRIHGGRAGGVMGRRIRKKEGTNREQTDKREGKLGEET